MDRKIEKSGWPVGRLLLVAIPAALLLYLIYAYTTKPVTGSSVTVDATRLTISEVARAPFQEFVNVNATVIPIRSIVLGAVEGGRVDYIAAESGASVRAGDTLLVMSNNHLQLDVMNREAQILEQMNTMRNTRIALQQQRLHLRNELLSHETELLQRRREYVRDSTLFARGMVSPHQYESTLQQYEQVTLRRDLFAEQLELDAAATEAELSFITESLVNMERNLSMVSGILENLVIRAPIDGQLTSLDAEIGEMKTAGQRIGQIDVLDGYKLRAQVDEVYITRLEAGQRAAFDFAGRAHELMITRIYPEVVDGRFQVDLDFTGEVPEALRRGQSVRLRMFFSEDEEAILVPRGGFFQQTSGTWMFVLSADGRGAERRPIRIGRQNAQFYVIEEGLQPGERVITSSYEGLAQHNRIQFR